MKQKPFIEYTSCELIEIYYRYPKIVDNITIPILEDYLSKEKAGQGKFYSPLQ
jgi:hypothetical protein